MKLCKECKWFDGTYCTVGAPSVDLVRGSTWHPMAGWMRRGGWFEARINRVCGREGRWWEAK